MKRIFTNKHESTNSLNNKERFSSYEHAQLTETELGNSILKNKKRLIQYSLTKNLEEKISNLSFLIKRINKKNYKKILSLGSGYSDLEYFLNLALDEDKELISSDFDEYIVEKANLFFPDFRTIQFDFFKDSLSNLDEDFELVFSFGAFYVMDDIEFIRLFKDIKSSGVKEIIDFHAGFMTNSSYLKYILKSIYSFVSNFLPIKRIKKGKFHGYMRNRKDLLRLYKLSGWTPINEIRNYGDYKYTCILN